MRKPHPHLTSSALVVLLAGCPTYEFQGDLAKVGFVSSLSVEHRRWNPATPVAVDSQVRVVAVEPRADAGIITPNVDASVLDDVELLPNQFSATAARSGACRVDWTGAASDTFTFAVTDVVGATLVDPVLEVTRAMDTDGGTAVWLQGGLWEDAPPLLFLVEGAPALPLFAALYGQDGGHVASDPSWVHASSSDPAVGVTMDRGYLMVSAPAGSAGALATVSVAHDNRTLAVAQVRVVSAADVARVELAAATYATFVAVKATALLPDGGTAWQAPFTWQHAGFDVPSVITRHAFTDTRTDVRVVTWGGDDAGPGDFQRPVSVQLSNMSQQVLVDVKNRGTRTDGGASSTPPATRACSCDASNQADWPATLAWLGGLLAVCGRRRSRTMRAAAGG